jgi:hypothetical protein
MGTNAVKSKLCLVCRGGGEWPWSRCGVGVGGH